VIAPVPLDLNNLMRDSEKLLRRVMGEDVELAATLQPGLWPVRCDPGQIEQVILNLAVNARDAMPRGGKLTIETANVEFDESLTTSHPGMRPEACVRLSVRDSGPGLSAEVKAHLFEPFFTTKPVGQGTGLGLATVYGIVKQNEGHILVDSEPGQGTTFKLFFPRIAESPAAAAPPAPATVTRGAETILVVEDDPQVREVTVRSLRAGGYRVLVAADGRGALDVAEHERGVHLLVTDVVMPGMSGREVADELCRRQPTLRVLYVSGYTHDAIAQRGVLDSGVEFLQKPFTASSLLERVRSVLDAP
jgi:two-component system cell cycle sensor histidine kinase/response regulator CckA